MLVQNHYQRRRLYTRIALGKNSAMDVVGGESAGGQGQLYILYPFLFGENGAYRIPPNTFSHIHARPI
jgi:hypothetical protein